MHILVTGNMGYIGPVFSAYLRRNYDSLKLTGLDTGYFAGCLVDPEMFPEVNFDRQFFMDIRDLDVAIFDGINAVVHLAAISNDPMGKAFEAVTEKVNAHHAVETAKLAKQAGATHFVFASSCSVYGFAEDGARTEESELSPLTAYARSKISAEGGLRELADSNFAVTCLRFGTACGWSPRLRLDLVLNDFVASGIANKEIEILSDGTPWRPMIHVRDMSRAMDWGANRKSTGSDHFVTLNAGSDDWNYQVMDLAYAVSHVLGDVEVSINPKAARDKRSYRVDFSKYRSLAPDYQPQEKLNDIISELAVNLRVSGFSDARFRSSSFMRLKVLKDACATERLTAELRWAT